MTASLSTRESVSLWRNWLRDLLSAMIAASSFRIRFLRFLLKFTWWQTKKKLKMKHNKTTNTDISFTIYFYKIKWHLGFVRVHKKHSNPDQHSIIIIELCLRQVPLHRGRAHCFPWREGAGVNAPMQGGCGSSVLSPPGPQGRREPGTDPRHRGLSRWTRLCSTHGRAKETWGQGAEWNQIRNTDEKIIRKKI